MNVVYRREKMPPSHMTQVIKTDSGRVSGCLEKLRIAPYFYSCLNSRPNPRVCQAPENARDAALRL